MLFATGTATLHQALILYDIQKQWHSSASVTFFYFTPKNDVATFSLK